jgi:hypothetical protein
MTLKTLLRKSLLYLHDLKNFAAKISSLSSRPRVRDANENYAARAFANSHCGRARNLIQKVKFLRPPHEEVCSMGGLLTLSALYLVQDLVSLIDSWAKLVLSSKARRIFEIADDASILEM